MSMPVKNPLRPLQANSGRLPRLPAVCELTGLRRSMIYMLESEKRLPQRIKLTAQAVAWRPSLHHSAALGQVLGRVVGSADPVTWTVR